MRKFCDNIEAAIKEALDEFPAELMQSVLGCVLQEKVDDFPREAAEESIREALTRLSPRDLQIASAVSKEASKREMKDALMRTYEPILRGAWQAVRLSEARRNR